jgi:divalent metal cation (Fe/Co/Zn/Cd) transporter
MSDRSDGPPQPSVGGLAIALIAFMVIGGAMVYFVWEGINELLMGEVLPRHLLIGLVMLVALIVLLRMLGRYIRRVDDTIEAPHPPSDSRG